MTVDLAGYIWFGIAVALAVAGLVYIGYEHHKYPSGDSLFLIWPLVIVSALWPLSLVVAVLSTPFWVGVGIAELSDTREEKRRKMRADEREALVRLRDSFGGSEPEWSILDEQIKSMA